MGVQDSATLEHPNRGYKRDKLLLRRLVVGIGPPLSGKYRRYRASDAGTRYAGNVQRCQIPVKCDLNASYEDRLGVVWIEKIPAYIPHWTIEYHGTARTVLVS